MFFGTLYVALLTAIIERELADESVAVIWWVGVCAAGLLTTGMWWVADEFHKKEEERKRWDASFEQFRDELHHISAPFHRTFTEWHPHADGSRWPIKLADAPIETWLERTKVDRTSAENSLLGIAQGCFSTTEVWDTPFERGITQMNRAVTKWVEWNTNSRFREHAERYIRDWRNPIVLFAYLEIARALALHSKGVPKAWTTLGRLWSHILEVPVKSPPQAINF